jgi:dihydroorotase-like cyclic amidohydrolase
MLLISNGRVLDPASGADQIRDILLDGDRIAAVAAPGQLAARLRQVLDATGLPWLPISTCTATCASRWGVLFIETGTLAAAKATPCPMRTPAR